MVKSKSDFVEEERKGLSVEFGRKASVSYKGGVDAVVSLSFQKYMDCEELS